MRSLFALIVLAAACGSKSPPPATPAEPAPAASEPAPEGPFYPEECDEYCAVGCNEVELYDECMKDCGCPDGVPEKSEDSEESED